MSPLAVKTQSHQLEKRKKRVLSTAFCQNTNRIVSFPFKMSALNLTVRVHPLVLFQVVDAFERRNAESKRVIGTLLGELLNENENSKDSNQFLCYNQVRLTKVLLRLRIASVCRTRSMKIKWKPN